MVASSPYWKDREVAEWRWGELVPRWHTSCSDLPIKLPAMCAIAQQPVSKEFCSLQPSASQLTQRVSQEMSWL